MIDGDVLEKLYKEDLEERLIARLAKVKEISLNDAMEIYYNSDLADKIARGTYGIQYLDHKVLVQILLENEEKSKLNEETH